MFELAGGGTFPAEPRSCTGENDWGSYSAVVRDHTNAGIIFLDPVQCDYAEGENGEENGGLSADLIVYGLGFLFCVFWGVVIVAIMIWG